MPTAERNFHVAGSVGAAMCSAFECPSADLPTTLAASESDGGAGVKLEFRRIIVYPDGHQHIEGQPKLLPSPSPVSVETNDQSIRVEKPSQNSASDDQLNQGFVDTDFR